MSKFIVGLTGGIGSGKTTIANLFSEFKIDIIDADIVAREVVQPGMPALKKIIQYFGKDIVQLNGELDRAKLRKKIFNNNENKLWLNKLLHPLIRQAILDQLAQATSQYCILVAPLLLENKLTPLVNKVLVIDVDEETQINRTILRDNNSHTLIKSIIDSQISRTERLAQADDIIDNQTLSIESLKQRVNTLHQQYIALANKC